MLNIWLASGAKVPVGIEDIKEACTVLALKQKLQSKLGVSRFQQRLLWGKDPLTDDLLKSLLAATSTDTVDSVDIQLVICPLQTDSHEQATRLRDAAARGQAVEVEEILQGPQDPNIADPKSDAPLLLACRQGHVEVVRLLIEARADCNKANASKETPLLMACGFGCVEIVGHLLEARARVHVTDGHGMTPLCRAAELAENLQTDIVRLLEDAGADFNWDKRTPLESSRIAL